MLISKENKKALQIINNKHVEIMNDKVIIVSHLLSPLSKIPNPEHTSQFKLVKDLNSNRVNDLLMNKTIPVTLYNNLLIFRDTDKKFELQGDLLKIPTNKNYIADLANSKDKNSKCDFAKEMYFDEKALGSENTRDKSLIILQKSPAIVAGSLKESNTRWLSSDANE